MSSQVFANTVIKKKYDSGSKSGVVNLGLIDTFLPENSLLGWCWWQGVGCALLYIVRISPDIDRIGGRGQNRYQMRMSDPEVMPKGE